MYLKEKPQCRQAIGLGACPVEGDREEEDTCRESSYVVARRVSEKGVKRRRVLEKAY